MKNHSQLFVLKAAGGAGGGEFEKISFEGKNMPLVALELHAWKTVGIIGWGLKLKLYM